MNIRCEMWDETGHPSIWKCFGLFRLDEGSIYVRTETTRDYNHVMLLYVDDLVVTHAINITFINGMVNGVNIKIRNGDSTITMYDVLITNDKQYDFYDMKSAIIGLIREVPVFEYRLRSMEIRGKRYSISKEISNTIGRLLPFDLKPDGYLIASIIASK